MGLRIFNTLSRSVQEFVPLDPAGKRVGLYCCGPTVYDFAHIGNWRTFIFGDLVRRYLEFKGYTVQHVMNITDVEDKIIKSVNAQAQQMDKTFRHAESSKTLPTKVSPIGLLHAFTNPFEAVFLEDLKTLNCLPPHQTPHATEHILEILALIEKLMAQGLAYKATDGSVYFSIEKYRNAGRQYGQLVNLNFDQMRVGERVQSDEYAKEAVADFALWKARAPEDGDVFWRSKWGDGRPGWHIECSAMSIKLLGPSFDIHLGGEDLMFPHHEDEIAQSEGAALQPPGQRFVKYWLHGAFLLVEGRKMSKSLGNFFTLRDLLAKGFTGREIRYALLRAHYRETFNFTTEGLQGARTALGRIEECLKKLVEIVEGQAGDVTVQPDAALISRFTEALDDDLNVSRAWGSVFEWVRDLNRSMAEGRLSPGQAAIAIGTWKTLDSVWGLNFQLRSSLRMSDAPEILSSGFHADIVGEEEAPGEIIHLMRQRMLARKAKDFIQADAIRDQLKAKGWAIEDTPKGPKLKKM